MSAKPGPLDYEGGWQLAEQLGALVRERHAAAEAASKASARAREAASDASQALIDVLRPWRELCTALVDGAGHDGKHPLLPAIEAAEQALAEQVG